jgi:hypothetical protein
MVVAETWQHGDRKTVPANHWPERTRTTKRMIVKWQRERSPVPVGVAINRDALVDGVRCDRHWRPAAWNWNRIVRPEWAEGVVDAVVVAANGGFLLHLKKMTYALLPSKW